MEDYINTIIDDLKYKRDEANNIASSIYSLSTSLGDAVGPIIGGFFTENNGFVDAWKYASLQNLFWFIIFTFSSFNDIKLQLYNKYIKNSEKGTELIDIKEENDNDNNEENEEFEEEDNEDFENEENEDDKIKGGNNNEKEYENDNKNNNDTEFDDRKFTMDETRRCSFDNLDDKNNNNGFKEDNNNNNNGDTEIVLDVIEEEEKEK